MTPETRERIPDARAGAAHRRALAGPRRWPGARRRQKKRKNRRRRKRKPVTPSTRVWRPSSLLRAFLDAVADAMCREALALDLQGQAAEGQPRARTLGAALAILADRRRPLLRVCGPRGAAAHRGGPALGRAREPDRERRVGLRRDLPARATRAVPGDERARGRLVPPLHAPGQRRPERRRLRAGDVGGRRRTAARPGAPLHPPARVAPGVPRGVREDLRRLRAIAPPGPSLRHDPHDRRGVGLPLARRARALPVRPRRADPERAPLGRGSSGSA